jgi:hypothetical protein
MPKNTLKFWKNLRREKLNNTNCLAPLRFAIFGLGDSSYPKYAPFCCCLAGSCITPRRVLFLLLTHSSLQVQLGCEETAGEAPAARRNRVL